MRKLIAISLSCILLLSNVGITLASHYCGGEAVESAVLIGGGKLDCGMDINASACENPQSHQATLHATPCCANHFTVVKVDNLTKTPEVAVPAVPVVFFQFAFREIFKSALLNRSETQLRAPDIPRIPIPDFGIFFQVFRL